MGNERDPFERRLTLVEDRQAAIEKSLSTRQDRLEENHSKLADSLVTLKKDLAETEHRLSDKVDRTFSEVRSTIQAETSQIDAHLSAQDHNILALSQAVLDQGTTWPLSARVILLAILLPIVIGLVVAGLVHFVF